MNQGTLRDPERCQCGGDSRVINSRIRPVLGYRVRRRACRLCAQRWSTYETLIHPKRLTPKPIAAYHV